MKLSIIKFFLVLTLTSGIITINASNAERVKTSKGYRLDTTQWKTVPLKDVEDFKTLRKGDKIAVYCPMKKRYMVTTLRNADSKGRVKIREARSSWDMEECGVVLKRKPGKREVQPMIVCPDGTLNPTTCKKLVPIKESKK
ncbi:MAG: hypothetical protein K1X66_08175 [Verrucomicrobiae bacterium]|nr:hypothetical protein [Verrucomicrobiae bacterium]